MTSVTLDPETSRRLRHAGPVVEVRDETGCVIGRFVAEEDKSVYAGVEPPPMSEEERERRRKAPRCSTEELIETLERRRRP